MEKILNDDERIRRAEEIYFRRNNMAPMKNSIKTNTRNYIKNKILFNLLIMLNLTVIIFAVKNKDYIFTSEFLDNMYEYNINIGMKIKEFLKTNESSNNEVVENEIKEENNENIVNEEKTNEEVEIIKEEKSSSISEMDLDIENIKAAYSFIKPLDMYSVSSVFGSRESEYQNVTGYHTGIDLAAEKGKVIKSAMEGIVDLASSEGDYGKHIKIRCNNVSTVYAHCSKILVKEGQIVAKGQPIGIVGSTGNSTGPHLHFEIRVDNRFVDPSKIIDF